MHVPITSWKYWMGWAIALGAAVFLVVLATLPPFLEAEGRAVVMQAFAPFCHQLAAYSPHVDGVQLGVGHRMYGIFLGLLLGTSAYPGLSRWDAAVNKHAALVLAVATAPMLLDWTLHVVGLWTKTPASRLATGGLFGVAAGYFLARACVQLISGYPAPRRRVARP